MAEFMDDYSGDEAEMLVTRGRECMLEPQGAAEGQLQGARQLLGRILASVQDTADTVVQMVFGGDRILATEVTIPPPTLMTLCRRLSSPASSSSCSPGSELPGRGPTGIHPALN
jgi:hypothetical protein